jgi:hypothetical protein
MERDRMLAGMRGAYERGRARLGVKRALLVLPMATFSWGCCGDPRAAIVVTAALAVLVATLSWRGGPMGRGVMPGLFAGIVPLLVPAAVELGWAASHRTFVLRLSIVACVLGGVASGAIVGRFARLEKGLNSERDRALFAVSAGAIAALAGTLGCVVVGMGGIAAMLAGLALATAPATRVRA